MDRKILNLFLGVSLFISISLFISCDDKDYYDPDKESEKVDDTPSTLDFSTMSAVNLDFNYKIAQGFRSTYDIYTESPILEDGTLRTDITPVASGVAVAGEISVRTLPAYATELYLYSPGLFVPRLSYAKVENGTAVFSQIEAPDGNEKLSRSTRSIGGKSIDRYLKQASDFYAKTENGVYENDLINPDKVETIPEEILTVINTTFPEEVRADPKYYTDATVEIQSDNQGQGVRVYVSVIHAAGMYNNSLSYFTYTGSKDFKDFTDKEKNNLKVINVFKYADVNTNITQNKNKGLTPGKYAQLLYVDESGNYSEFFPVGSKIGWILHANAYNGISNGIKTSHDWMYSTPEWNEYVYGNRNRTIFFEAKSSDGTSFACFGFEDCPSSDSDCNDVIFRVLTDPADAIVPPPAIDTEDIEKDEVKKGVLAFEDMWPTKGDYDLNDVVVKYKSTVTYIQEVYKNQDTGEITGYGATCVSKLTDEFSLIHAGASYKNAFYYKIDIDPSLIKSLKIDNQDYTPVKDGNGFIIELCPLVASEDGSGAIAPWAYGTTPKNYTVEIEFEKGELLEKDYVLVAAPYNPFIEPQIDKYSNVEVHLPNYLPTTRVDYSFFGTEDDHSDQKTLWYVSGANNLYPFAIHLANVYDNFAVSAEGKSIDTTYPQFNGWVESGMTENLEWYLNPAK